MAGLVPAIRVESHGAKNVDARAFAAPKGLRPRRRDKPGHDAIIVWLTQGLTPVESRLACDRLAERGLGRREARDRHAVG
jgi:hypothetical protein